MPLKMATLCPDASLETLRSLLSWHALSPGGPLQAVQVVMLSASHVLQNSPQFIVQGVEVWTP